MASVAPTPMESSAVPSQILFLPGALGRTRFWEPVANLLTHPAPKRLVPWPGFGSTPPDPHVNGIDDLVRMVTAGIDRPTALVAQSMGGVIAVRVALEKPDLITHLVLAVTSGGINGATLAGQDWRPAYHESNPLLPRWFSTYQEDLSARLSALPVPTLLLWGSADPISPVCDGERLASLLPWARLHVVEGGDHDLAETHACRIAPLIDAFLATDIPPAIAADRSRAASAGP